MTSNATLPDSIRRQIEEAEAIERQLYGEPAPEGNTEASTVVEEAPAPAKTVVETVVTQPETVVQADEEDSFRRRYDVLRGKYDAEIPRMHQQVRELTSQLQGALGEIERIKTETRTTQQEPQKPDTDAETFGEDLVEMADRRAEKKARELVAAETKQLIDYVRSLESKLGVVNEQVSASKETSFYDQLAKQVPNYAEINANQGFLNWLAEVDPIYGLPRQAALDDAAAKFDSARVAGIFMAYNSLTGKQEQAQQRQQVRQELERQVAPSAAKSSSTPITERVWTLDEYTQALDPRNISKLGRAKADELYADAERAYAEGRVRA